MRRRTASLDPHRPRVLLHEGPAWVVEAGRLAGSGEPVACKRARRPGFHARTLLRAELDVARAAHHDHLVQGVALVEHDGVDVLCLAPQCLGPVAGWIEGPWDPAQVAGVVHDVADALAALHAAGWVHGRVDDDHVLVGPDGHAVLAGLGGARRARAARDGAPDGPVGDDGADPAADVAALAELALDHLEPSGTDPGAVGLRSVLGRMADPEPSSRPSAATAVDLVRRFGPRPRPLPVPMPDEPAADPDSAEGTAGLRRPEPAAPTARHRGPTVVAVVALAAVACLVLGGRQLVAAPAPPTEDDPPPCPLAGAPAAPGAEVAAVDVDGRGCTVPVRRDPTTGALEVVTTDGVRRYELGGPGDRVVLGDWDCDGAATPLLVRPGAANGWRYDRWPTGVEPVRGEPVALDGPGGAPPPPRCGPEAP